VACSYRELGMWLAGPLRCAATMTLLFKRPVEDDAPVLVGSTGALEVETHDESAAGETFTATPCSSHRLRSASSSRLCLLASRLARASPRSVVVSPASSVSSAANRLSWRALSRLSVYRMLTRFTLEDEDTAATGAVVADDAGIR